MSLSTARQTIADYAFLRSLGEGTQGTVYLATPPSRLGLGSRPVAVKILTRRAQAAQFDLVADELLTYASRHSPFLNPLLDAGLQDDGTVFYAVEYASRLSLAEAHGLAAADVVRAIARAARGAHALHEAGIAHRLIKPTNVLLFDEGAKLTDLALQHLLVPGQTVTGRSSADTLQYIAPELVRGDAESRASDVWALGVTLHVALTGRGVHKFGAEGGLMAALRAMMSAAEPQVDPSLPAGLAAIIVGCVAADPTARPTTAERLAERLEAEVGAA